MRILVFSPYYPPHIGGLESHADEFNENMAKRGVHITVFTPQIPHTAPQKETLYGSVHILRFPAFELIPKYPFPQFWRPLFWHMLSALSHEQTNIVISRTRFFLTSLIALAYAKTHHLPLIHIEHGSDFVKHTPLVSFCAKIYDYTFGRLVFSTANVIVANSEATAQFCKKFAPRKECVVIYRGIAKELIDSTHLNQKVLQMYPHPIIVFLGRLINGKGVEDLIRAVFPLKNYTLLIIGDGPQKKYLQKIARNNSHIVFYGQKERADALSILKAADILVNPSYTEGLPSSVTEAALCKKAIVATDVGGTREIITH